VLFEGLRRSMRGAGGKDGIGTARRRVRIGEVEGHPAVPAVKIVVFAEGMGGRVLVVSGLGAAGKRIDDGGERRRCKEGREESEGKKSRDREHVSRESGCERAGLLGGLKVAVGVQEANALAAPTRRTFMGGSVT
jgi:hypothetical protein